MRNAMIEVINYQSGVWQIKANGECFTFSAKPVLLIPAKSFLPLIPDCENGLRWRIKGKWISYNRIKEEIQNYYEKRNKVFGSV